MDREVQGQVRPGLGQAARGDTGAPETARRGAAGDKARAEAGGDQGLGRADPGREKALRSSDGGLRRVRRVRRHGDRPTDPGHRGDRPARQHARLLHRRRQRGERRRGHGRALQRVHLLQRRARNRPGHPQALRRARRPDDVSTLRRRVGGRGGHALHVDEAGRLELRRHPQRDGGPLAQGHRGERPGAIAVAPRHRHCADHLEAAGLAEPKSVNGTAQTPIEGVSLAYTFADAKAPSRHKTQYFEIFGNRAIYSDGWLAGTIHRAAWEFKVRRPLEDDVWELYDTRADFSLANDLAAKNSEKLKEMQDLFLKEAVKYSVLPLDDRLQERFVAALVGRPDLMAGRTSLTVYQGMTGMSENVFINLKNKSHTITAEVEIPKKGANGVIVAQAGRFGGWSLYLKDGEPTYTYNWLGLQRYTVAATQPVPAGKATITFDFAYDGGGLG